MRVQRLAGWCAEACVGCMRKCHYPAVRSLRSHRPRTSTRAGVLRRCPAPTALRSTAASQPSAAERCAAQQVAPADRPRFGPLNAHIVAVLHRPCALPGAIDHGCDSVAYGRTGDTREHKRCACTPCRAHIPASRPPRRKTAGASAPPTPTAEAVNDTSTPLYTAGVSTPSTLVSPCEYVEYHREYSKVPHCRCADADGRGGE